MILFCISIGSIEVQALTPPEKSAGDYYNEGLSYKAQGRAERARRAMLMAMRADPTGMVGKSAEQYLRNYLPRFPVSDAAQEMSNRAYNLKDAQKTDEAKRVYLQCIRQHPFFEWPYNNLALIYYNEGELDAAEKLLKTALAIKPTYVNGLLTLGWVKARQGDIPSARNAFARALTLDPTNEEAKERLRLCR